MFQTTNQTCFAEVHWGLDQLKMIWPYLSIFIIFGMTLPEYSESIQTSYNVVPPSYKLVYNPI